MTTPLSEFDTALTLTPVDSTSARSGGGPAFTAQLSDRWAIGGAVNGGLLLALLGKAASRAGEHSASGSVHPDPLAISAHYLSASVGGPARIETEIVRSGRTTSVVSVHLEQKQDDKPTGRVRALVTTGDLDALDGPEFITPPCPELPPPDQCYATTDTPQGFKSPGPFTERLDVRLTPGSVAWALGDFSAPGTFNAWIRFPDGREPDPISLLQIVDALPPVTYTWGHFGWAPTVELTAYVRARPAPGWLSMQISTSTYARGFLEEDVQVWDSTGELVAQARQLASAPRFTQKT